MTKKAWKWEPAIKLEPRGHRIFRDARDDYRAPELRGWAIADDSGDYPHTTDDGVLWLDFERPIIVAIGGERPSALASLPVLKHNEVSVETKAHGEFHVSVGIKALVAITKRFPGWRVSLSNDLETLLLTLRTTLELPKARLKHLVDHATGNALRSALAAYEATGDHNHGNGPLGAGAACGGGDDCWVMRARVTLSVIDTLNHNRPT